MPTDAELLDAKETLTTTEVAKRFNMSKGEVAGRIYRAKHASERSQPGRRTLPHGRRSKKLGRILASITGGHD